ncbi:hypothetical protein EKK58_07290 [Candidatus Dependentiae bacterium]|nr:MAG: hypothetical protein EKK58_07290 [Candidatus Dependentiae bacterium]
MAEIKETLNQRSSRYGTFEQNVKIVEGFKAVMEASPSYEYLTPMHKEVLGMVFHKMSRMLSGDPNYIDNVHDIIGYSKILEDYLIKLDSEKPKPIIAINPDMKPRVDILIKGGDEIGRKALHNRLFQMLGKEDDLEVVKTEVADSHPPMLHVIWKD